MLCFVHSLVSSLAVAPLVDIHINIINTILIYIAISLSLSLFLSISLSL